MFIDEPHLVTALQQRQEPAFEYLVNNYKDRLYNVCLSILQNVTAAEDAVQETFIKAFEKINSFKAEASIGTWLYRIAVNQSLQSLRRTGKNKQANKFLNFFGLSTAGADEHVEFNHPGVIIENKERAAILFKALKHLPEKQKTAFVLQKTEGLSQQQIAQVMQLSEGAVESLLSRAKANLKKLLQQYYSS